PDAKRVKNSGLAVVLQADAEPYHFVVVRPGPPADVPGVGKKRIDQVAGDLRAVDMVGVGASVIDVIDVTPERTVFAPPVRAEGRFRSGRIKEDEAAAGDEIARCR